MFIRKKKYPSENIGIIVVEKINGKMKELTNIGIAKTNDEIENLVQQGLEWIDGSNIKDLPLSRPAQ